LIHRDPRSRVVPIVAALLGLLAGALGAEARLVPATLAEGGAGERVELREWDDTVYLRLSDLARIARASRHWNAETRKMTVSVRGHRLALSPDNAFVKCDNETRNLHRPVLMREGGFWVPEAFLNGALGPASELVFQWEGEREGLRILPRAPTLDGIAVREGGGITTVSIELSRLPEYRVETRASDEIDVTLWGASLADTLGAVAIDGLVRSVRADSGRGRLDIVIGVAGAARTFTVDAYRSPDRIDVRIEGGVGGGLPEPGLREEKHVAAPVAPFATGGRRIDTVIVDAGHGGRDGGAVGRSGLVEKDVTLALGRRLSRALEARGFHVLLTRSSDTFVPLKRRAEIANLAAADLLVSIQCDAAHSGSASGATVLYFRPPDEEEPVYTGRLRPGLKYVPRGGGSVAADRLLWKRMQEGHIGTSRALARTIRAALRAEMPDRDRGVAGRDLELLAGCAMPAVVVEVGFITNRDDETLLGDESFQEEVANLIAGAIDEYRRNSERSER